MLLLREERSEEAVRHETMATPLDMARASPQRKGFKPAVLATAGRNIDPCFRCGLQVRADPSHVGSSFGSCSTNALRGRTRSHPACRAALSPSASTCDP